MVVAFDDRDEFPVPSAVFLDVEDKVRVVLIDPESFAMLPRCERVIHADALLADFYAANGKVHAQVLEVHRASQNQDDGDRPRRRHDAPGNA